jgi:hypothetical protein
VKEEHPFGLSSANRNFIVGLVAAVLLLFGPIEPYGLTVRFAYLVIIPAVVWLLLLWLGARWDIDALTNDRIQRALFAGIAGLLLVGAYQSYSARWHTECDQSVQTRDGEECVGDYVPVKGGDKGAALLLLFLAGIAGWCSIARPSE